MQDGTICSQVDLVTWAFSTYVIFIIMSGFSYAGCPYDCGSTCCHDVFLRSNLISWSSRKQRKVSQFSVNAEAKYKSVANVMAQIMGIVG
jgi:hypothetical protein